MVFSMVAVGGLFPQPLQSQKLFFPSADSSVTVRPNSFNGIRRMSIPAIEVIEIRPDAAEASSDVSQTGSGNSEATDVFAEQSEGGYLDEGATGAVAGEQESWAVAQEEPNVAEKLDERAAGAVAGDQDSWAVAQEGSEVTQKLEKSVTAENQEAATSEKNDEISKDQESVAENPESGSLGDVEASSNGAGDVEGAIKGEKTVTRNVENVDNAENADHAERAEIAGRAAGLGDVYAVAEQGGVMDRLRTLCLAPAVAATLARRLQGKRDGDAAAMAAGTGSSGSSSGSNGTKVTIIWDNNADNGFNSLFAGPPRVESLAGVPSEMLADVAVEETLDESRKGRLTAEIEVAIPECKGNESTETRTTSASRESVRLLLSSAIAELVAASGSGDTDGRVILEICTVRRLEAACLGGVRPSAGVAAIMRAQPASALSALPHSTAVYLERGAAAAPGAGNAADARAAEEATAAAEGTCGGCANDPLLNCTIRTLAWRFLRAGSTHLSSSSASSPSSPSSPSSSSSPSTLSPESSFIVAAFEPENAAAVAASFHPSRAPLLLPVTQARLKRCSRSSSSPADRRLLHESSASDSAAAAAAAAAAAGAAAAPGLDVTVWEGDNIEWSCVQLQVAEAWVVSAAAALIHTRASLEARFLLAQASAGTARRILSGATGGGEGTGVEEGAEGADAEVRDSSSGSSSGSSSSSGASFVVEPSVCEAPPAVSFKGTAERFLRQFIVDEKLKTIYCFVPKVACTSWKTWFRQQQQGQGQKNISDVYLTHDHYKSGLRILAYHYNEYEVIRLLTRPDFFKFSFIRNPYARLASVYFNKHVNGGPPFGRQFWNKMFFRGITPYRKLVEEQGGKDLFGFSDFAYLLRSVEERLRSYMESHVQPQMDVCRFDAIKFDFIGRFENLDADVAEVLHRLNKTDASGAFSIGLNAHRTNAEDKLTSLYDE
ncbi:unnamed protein product, partial [Closterium sp. NIES-64]